MKITRFTGINNVTPPERLPPDQKKGISALVQAMNVNIDTDGQVLRRAGCSKVSEDDHADVWEGVGFTLAVVDGDLVRIVDGTPAVIKEGVGTDRMWYWNWPDGRTAYSNGTAKGIASLTGRTDWGVPTPDSAGTGAGASGGQLYAGKYFWGVRFVRADGLEGGVILSDAITLTAGQKLALSDLPTLDGHITRVCLTHHDSGVLWRAGDVDEGETTFDYVGKVEQLVRQAENENTEPPPPGRLLAMWNGRAMVAVDNVLFPSKHLSPEHFDLEDAKLFSATITLVQPVRGGVFVGTTHELVFLGGETWDRLAIDVRIPGPAVLGSGVTAPGEYVKRGDGVAGAGSCMLGIVGGHIVAGYPDGSAASLTLGVFTTDATEVAATFRVEGGIGQYIAIAQ